MKNNFTSNKHLNFFFAFLFIGIISVISTCSLSATIITKFPPSDFWIVDHTTQGYTVIDSHQYNPTGIIGYYHKVDNEYQLTDTIPIMTVAMWCKKQIDMNQSWQFDLKLFFDIGTAVWNQSILVNSSKRRIADGMCFVLHNKNVTPNLIGGTMSSIGYGGISPSFAIEFDTEYNDNEGGFWDMDHIAYLKNGQKTALSGTYRSMQNGWANIGQGDWFDVKIVWRKNYYANNVQYYDLLTYMREGPNTNKGPLLLRDSMRFYNLNEVIEGLEVDSSTCQALVTWGVTSATCDAANKHMVDFVKLEATMAPSTLTAVVLGNCEWNRAYSNSNPPDTLSLPTKSMDMQHRYMDTIMQYFDITDCYGVSQPPTDTIEYTISCLDTNIFSELYCDHTFELHGIPYNSECKYYINGILTDSAIYDTTISSSNKWVFPLNRQYFINDSAVRIKILINNTEYNFKILSEDNTIDWAEKFAQELNIQLDKDMRSGTLELNSNSITQSIQLPDSLGCSYQINRYYSSSSFLVPPAIDNNNILTFELKPDACSAGFDISMQCGCGGIFTLFIENADCNDYICEAVTIKRTAYTFDIPQLPYHHLYSTTRVYNYFIKTSEGSGHSIANVSINALAPSNSSLMTKNLVYRFDDTTCGVSAYFSDMTLRRDSVIYEICATLDNGTICCDTFQFVSAGDYSSVRWLTTSLDRFYKAINYTLLDTNLLNSLFVPPLYVKAFDAYGNSVTDGLLHDGVPVSAEGTIHYNLQNGLYFIQFTWGEYIETIPISISGY